jgi:multidrug transporter EmrE-like cation transporter
MNYYLLLLALCASIVAILPIVFIKQYIITKQIYNLILAFILYVFLLLSYVKLFETEQVSSTYTILQILQILIMIVVGLMIFNESLTINKILGIIFGIVSIYLLLN